MAAQSQPAQLTFSVITPEHTPDNAPFLTELFDTLVAQTYPHWEWVVYLNGTMTPAHLPPAIRDHPQVRVIVATDPSDKRIGAIKHAAFMAGGGDVLVEVDHDDLLTPDCLEKLAEAYADASVGFVYSDNAVLQDEFVPFAADNGWTWREFRWGDKTLKAMHSFEPTSHSLALIYFAPDHVRSWRASVYRELGGHDASLDVCDDHDLCIRTYLATKMKRVPEVLYLYRITGHNTFLERNASIQRLTQQLFHKYAQRLAARDAQLRGLQCADLGGTTPGYVPVPVPACGELRLPFPDGSVGVLVAHHTLARIPNPRASMEEIHRVLAPGGWAFLEVPSTDGRGAFQDPRHVSYWNENSFKYYTQRYLAEFIGNAATRFQEYRLETHYPNDWMRSMNVCVTTAWLAALKGDMPRLPGRQGI